MEAIAAGLSYNMTGGDSGTETDTHGGHTAQHEDTQAGDLGGWRSGRTYPQAQELKDCQQTTRKEPGGGKAESPCLPWRVSEGAGLCLDF